MQAMKFFFDTDVRGTETFPAELSAAQFAAFYTKYEAICREEGVINLRAHVGLEDGRAYCFNMAPSADAVRRAHERAGLPFDTITEVETVTPGEMFMFASTACAEAD